MFAALSSSVSTLLQAGISVKNESAIPLLIIVSQLTPLHWSSTRVMPGETFNEGNKLGMGKVWFTVSASMFDERNVPTVTGTAVNLLALTATVVIPLPTLPLFIGAAFVSGFQASRGVAKTGVYSDGCTLYVRGSVANDGVYALHFADEPERRNLPFVVPLPLPDAPAADNPAPPQAAKNEAAAGEEEPTAVEDDLH